MKRIATVAIFLGALAFYVTREISPPCCACSAAQVGPVPGRQVPKAPGTVTIDTKKTAGGKNRFTVVASWKASDGYRFAGKVQILLLNKKGGQCRTLDVLNKNIASLNYTHKNDPQLPAGAYTVIVVVRFTDNANKVSLVSSKGLDLKITN